MRSEETEFLDRIDSGGREVRAYFRLMVFTNRWFGGHAAIRRCLEEVVRGRTKKGLSVLDAGCGIGDTAKMLRGWAGTRGIPLTYTGVDSSRTVIAAARKSASGEQLRFIEADLLDAPGRADIVLASMVLHHFPDRMIGEVLRRLASRADEALIVTDLRRCAAAYCGAWLVSLVLGTRLSRADALASVRKGFTPDELSLALKRTGLKGTVMAFGPGRVCLLVFPSA
ncbi:MAG: methyltransferase domain-containing protein [Deltaproteobacteria bacterium]